MRIVVLGAGESGRGVALLAQDLGHDVLVSDAGQLAASAKTELEQAGIAYEQGGHSRDDIDSVDFVVKSPGIPWTAEFVAFAKTRGVRVVGEMEFCALTAPDRMRAHHRIGITGSNGKTTTTLLTQHLLAESGFSAVAAGNVGTSYARVLLTPAAYDWVVLELSSYQLEDVAKFHCEIAMLLNLSPDHLDRYGGSFAAYAAAKYKLLCVAQPGDAWLEPPPVDYSASGLESVTRPQVPSGVEEVVMQGSYSSGVALVPALGDDPAELYDLTSTVLSGPHNAANASFALTAARLAGAMPDVLAKALKTFVNAPHRLESVGYVNGVRYVNDSKATNLDATEKALRSYTAPIVLIAGGTDKGNDWSLLDEALDATRLRGVVALGVDSQKIVDYFERRGVDVVDTHNLNIAIVSAGRLAKSGDVVLLSPACASFDLFANYIDRGDQFRQAVRELPGFRETL